MFKSILKSFRLTKRAIYNNSISNTKEILLKDSKFRSYWKTNSALIGILLASSFIPIYYKDKIQLYANKPSSQEFHHLCNTNNVYAIENILKNTKDFDVNQKHPLGWNPIHVACIKGYKDLVKLLIEYNTDLNVTDKFKIPNKISGSELRFIIYEREAFSDNIRVDAQTSGFTPLHYACFNGDFEIIKLLAENGADPTLIDDSGYLPEDYLEDYGMKTESIKTYLNDIKKKQKEDKILKEKELRKKYPIEQQLHEHIVGQVAPINAVASAIRRKENGWHDEDRPLVFLFLGSSGVGKTELAKQMANYIHKGNKEAFIRMDMSEFQSKHEVAKFVGSPPGYIGYEEGGQLTEKLNKCPNAVVLLDEVEKAHPDVLTIMLQVFDEGRLTDGKGIVVDCKDAIFVMTSNLAQQEIAEEAVALRSDAKLRGLDNNLIKHNVLPTLNKNEAHNRTVLDESIIGTPLSKKFIDQTIYPILRNHFKRDEFLGRISATLFFLPFDEKELEKIVEKELIKWSEKAKNRHGMELSWSREVIVELCNGYNYRYGARSIKHEVEQRVVNQIAKAHELDQIKEGSKIFLSLTDERNIQLILENI